MENVTLSPWAQAFRTKAKYIAFRSQRITWSQYILYWFPLLTGYIISIANFFHKWTDFRIIERSQILYLGNSLQQSMRKMCIVFVPVRGHTLLLSVALENNFRTITMMRCFLFALKRAILVELQAFRTRAKHTSLPSALCKATLYKQRLNR